MACFQLVDCQDGVSVMWVTDDILNPTLVVGQVIGCNEVQGHCLQVQDFGGVCVPLGPLTGIIVYPGGCQECLASACACPQGTTEVTLPDGTVVCREDIVVLAEGPIPQQCQRDAVGINNPIATLPALLFGPSPQYSRYGAKFYGETSGLPWPINFSTGCVPGSQAWNSFPATPLPVVNTVSNAAWGTGAPFPYDGRVNAGAGIVVGNTPCGGPLAGGQRYGTVFCLNNPTTKTYSFGFMGFAPEILINGIAFVQATMLAGDIYQYETWTVIQLTLPAGNYIIQMSAAPGTGIDSCGNFTFNNPPLAPRNPFSIVGWAFEIYDATVATLVTMTTQAQVDAVVVYSTKTEDGQPLDFGESTINYRCPCPIPPPPPAIPDPCPDAFGNYNIIKPILDNCTVNPLNPNANPSIYVCHTFKYTPASSCCYLLTNCDPTASPATVLTSTNLSLEIGNVITVNGPPGAPPIIGCFIVSLGQCDGTEIAVTVVQSFGPAADGGCAACAPKCYMLEDCEGIIAPFIVTDDLSAYVGLTVQLCPPPGSPFSRENGAINNFTDQIVLTDCCNPNNKVRGNSSSFAVPYLGTTIVVPSLGSGCWVVDPTASPIASVAGIPSVPLNWMDPNIVVKQGCQIDCPPCTLTLTQCGCFIVTLAGGCQGAIPLPGVITAQYVDCADCAPKCYQLVDCSDPSHTLLTNTDLSLYLGQVVYIDGCPGVCWIVTLALDCIGAVPVIVTQTFVDCLTCNPPPIIPPVELRPRSIKPGYTTPGCDPAYTELVSCNFANAAYDEMTIKRYGITMCCNEPIEKWDIKKQLLDLRAIYDPDLCKNTMSKCCPPCAMVAELVVYGPLVNCDPPTGIIATIEIPPTVCPPPTGIQAVISIP